MYMHNEHSLYPLSSLHTFLKTHCALCIVASSWVEFFVGQGGATLRELYVLY